MTQTQTVETTLIQMECSICGAVFGMSNAKYTRCRERLEHWWCPNGHRLVFKESEVERLKQELAHKTRLCEYAEADLETTQRSLTATRGVVTRTRNRIARGACPCCHRHFGDLQRHMETKHPGYA